MNTIKKMRHDKCGLLFFAAIFLFFCQILQAQVTIGDNKPPEPFSILELSTQNTAGGLRLPHLDETMKLAIGPSLLLGTVEGKGLVIYNTDIDCVEYWDGAKWVNLCDGNCPMAFAPASVGEVTYSGGTSVQITASNPCCSMAGNYTYTLIIGSNYATVSAPSSDGKFQVTFDPNSTGEPRVALVQIVDPCGNKGMYIVGQQANPSPQCGVTFSPKTETVPNTANATTSTIQASDPCCSASGNYTIVKESGDLDVTVNWSNPTTGQFTVQFANANAGSAPRVAVVKVTSPCGNVGYFVAVQAGTSGSSCVISFSPSSVTNMVYTGGTTSAITVSSAAGCCPGGTYSFSLSPSVSYATVNTLSATQFSVTFTHNNTKNVRVAVVKAECSGNAGYFVVVQDANPTAACGVTFSPQTETVPNTATATTSTIQANDPCCSSGGSYTIVKESGDLDATVNWSNPATGQFTVQFANANTGATPRVAVVKVTSPCGNVGYFVAVQAGTSGSSCPITLSETSATVLYTGGTTNTITASSPAGCCPGGIYSFTLNPTGSYATLNNLSATQFSVTFSHNNTKNVRVAVIKAECSGNTGYFVVVQAANPAAQCGVVFSLQTETVEHTANVQTLVITASDPCCTGTYDFSMTFGADYAWISSQNTSTGQFRVEFTSANPNSSPRIAIVRAISSCGNIGYFVAVQKVAPTSSCVISFSPASVTNMGYTGGTTSTIVVSSAAGCCPGGTYSFSLSPSVSYATVNTVSATQFSVTFTHNNTKNVRVAVVKATCNGNEGYFVVVQEANPTAACGVTFSARTETVSNAAGATTTTIQANDPCCSSGGSYTIVKESGDADVTINWSNPATGQFTVRFGNANTVATPRVAVIKVTSPCDNVGYFVAVQAGTSTSTSCPVSFNPGSGTGTLVDATGGYVSSLASSTCCPSGFSSGFASVESAYTGYATITSSNPSTGAFTVTFATNASSDARVAVVKITDNCLNVGYFVAVQKGAAASGGSGDDWIYYPLAPAQLPAKALPPGNYRYYFAAVCLGSGNASATPSTGNAVTTFYCSSCNPQTLPATRFTGDTYESHTTRTLHEATRFASNHLKLEQLQTCNAGSPCSRPSSVFMLDFTIPQGATGWTTATTQPSSPMATWTITNGTACTQTFPQVVAIQRLN